MSSAKLPPVPTRTLVSLGSALAGAAVLGGLALFNRAQARRAEERYPARGRFIQVSGVRLHYLERGEGPPVVLLHGNGATAEDFEVAGLIDRLSSNHRVLAFDRPGFGYSTRPRDRTWTAKEQAWLIQRALSRLSVEKPIVVGHSWGTLAAASLALDFPDDVGALVLLSGYYFPAPRVDVLLSTLNAVPVLGDILNHTIAPLIGKLMAPIAVKKVFAPDPVPERFGTFPLALSLRPQQLAATAQDTAQMIPAALAMEARYHELAMPIAIVAGERDEIVETEAQSERLAKVLRQSAMTIEPETGHMVHYFALDRIVEAVDRIADTAKARDAAPSGARAIIFDIDGTLVDSVDLHAEAWQEALRDFGHDIEFDVIRHQIGKGGDQLMPALLSKAEIAAHGEALEQHRSTLFKARYLSRVVAFPQVRTLFERLRADGKRIVLASSAKKDEIAVYKKIAGITDLVETEVSGDDVSKSKPHGDIFAVAIKKLANLGIGDIIAVGDTPYDAAAAAKAGIRTVGVLCGGFPKKELTAAGCFAIYQDPKDLLLHYDRWTVTAAH
jgi:phosphoglycolate phosphatase-like HAD superfamily hydrolase/pimeloyl-ACP methyl ester carboxylesterase